MMAFFASARNVTLAMCIVLAVFLATTSPFFLNQSNGLSLQMAMAAASIIGIGMMVLLITGYFDLSVGSIMGLSGILCAMMLNAGIDTPVAVVGALLIGAGFGFINGFLVGSVGVNPLIATLGTMFIGRGIVETLVLNTTLDGFTGFPASFLAIGEAQIGGIYLAVWIALVIAILVHVAITRFFWGRSTFYVGGDREAARAVGFPIRRIIIGVYCLSGVLAALAGVIETSRIQAANRYLGEGIEFEILIACLIGGASMAGGKGSVFGAIIGTMLMVLLRNFFNLYEIDPQFQKVVLGLVLILAVVWDAVARNLSKRRRLSPRPDGPPLVAAPSGPGRGI